MKKVLGLVALVSLFGTSAMAADLPVKAPTMVAAPAFSWTGFYVGAHVGYGWGRVEGTNVNGNAPFPAGTRHGTDVNGILGGVQAGYNYQFAPNWVAGLEGEFSWSGMDGDSSVASVVPGFTTTRLTSFHDKVNWLATVTGRLGYAAGNWLWYVKGGAAFAQTESGSVSTNPAAGGAILAIGNATETRTGWTIGTGWEWAFWNNWSAKVEYNYMDFGSETQSHTVTYFGVAGVNPVIRNVDFHVNVVKFGLNYRFNTMH